MITSGSYIGETGKKFGLRIKEHKKEVAFHSWYTNLNLQGKREQCNSQVSHHRPCRAREPCHRLRQGKSGLQRESQRQTRWIKEAHWIMKTPICVNRDAGSYQLRHTWDQVISRSRAPSSCKQDMIKMSYRYRNIVIR